MDKTRSGNRGLVKVYLEFDSYDYRLLEVAAQTVNLNTGRLIHDVLVDAARVIIARRFGPRPVGGYAFELPLDKTKDHGVTVEQAPAEKPRKKRRRRGGRKDRRKGG